MGQPHSYSNTSSRLHDLRERIQRGQAGSEDLLALVSCVEELVAGLEKPREEVARSLRGLKNQQRILDSHVAAIENRSEEHTSFRSWLLFHAWRSSSPASKSRGRKWHGR